MQLNKNTMVMWWILLRWDNWHNVQPCFCLTSADLSLRQWGDIKFVYILKESMFQVPREINLESQVQELATWSLIRAWAAPCRSDSFGATLPSRSFWTATDEAENCHIWNKESWWNFHLNSKSYILINVRCFLSWIMFSHIGRKIVIASRSE